MTYPAKKLLLSLFALLALGTPLAAKPLFKPGTALPPPSDTPSDDSPASPISLALMKQITQRLSADDFEGRAPSTAVEPKVLDYIVSQFKAAGLQPGNKGQWLQEVPTVEITSQHQSPLTITGGTKPLSFQFGSQWVGATSADDHMMTAEGIEESLFILGASFSSNMWPSMWDVPNYDRWYRGRDDTDSYRWLADVLRLIGAGDDRRWLLKNPTDLFSLQEVLNVFPDAKIIQTHRDPVDSMPSVSNLIYSARRAFCGDKADPAAVGRREAEIWAQALERADAVRRKSDNVFVDVEFRDFTRDQMATIRMIYERFDLVLTPATERAMQAWLDAHPHRPGTGPKHRPEDFGLTRAALEARFHDYRRRRGYA